MQHAKILIIGAGPVGLSAALSLHWQGIPCRLIDKNSHGAQESRALGIHSRTLEMLERLGVLERFFEEGLQGHGGNLYSQGKKLAHLSFKELEAPFPMVLLLPQNKTESILAHQLDKIGITVEREVELVGLYQEEAFVRAFLRHKDGSQEEVETPYLLGCDGAHSSVRHLTGLSFEGEALPGHYVLADVHVDWDLADDELHTFFHPEGILFCAPMGNKRWRLIADFEDEELPEEPTFEFVQALVDKRGPGHIRLYDPIWISTFHLQSRMVDHFQKGRVFLSGDAAHIHSPAGGQGMNTGMQDAFNLAWKLALVLRGHASPDLLATYDVERRPNARALLSGTERINHALVLRHPLARALRNRIMAFVSQWDVVRHQIEKKASQLTVRYQPNSILIEHTEGLKEWLLHWVKGQPHPCFSDCFKFSKGPTPGERAPDVVEVIEKWKQPARLFETWVQDPRHQLLVFSGLNAQPQRIEQLQCGVKQVNERYGDFLKATFLLPEEQEPQETSILVDPEARAHHRYGAQYECLYLIRPDGFVGYRSQPVDFAAWDHYWNVFLLKSHR